MNQSQPNFVCRYGLYHDKPVQQNLKPSSNNGWIYSAIAQELHLPIDKNKLQRTYRECKVSVKRNFIKIFRLPNKKEPPISHDEIIGLYLLGMIDYSTLKANHFVYYGKGEPMNKKTISKILSGLAQLAFYVMIKGKHHRNMFWKKNIKNMYQAAFRLHPAYAYFLKKDNGIKPHEEERLIWKLYTQCTLDKGTAGEKNILYLMASRLGDKKLMSKCKFKTNIGRYFGAHHVFTRRVNDL